MVVCAAVAGDRWSEQGSAGSGDSWAAIGSEDVRAQQA
jgi:hypothetical protein